MRKTSLTSQEVKHIAKLAALSLSESEIEKFRDQLSKVVEYIQTLSSVDVNNVKVTSQITGLENVTRKDEPAPSLSEKEALSNTKNAHNGFIKVKAIFDEKTE